MKSSKIQFHSGFAKIAPTFLLLFVTGLTGCTMGSVLYSSGEAASATAGNTISGTLHGGQQPIYNARVQLYAAATPSAPTSGNPTGGIGQGATALLSSPATTDVNGQFSITGSYTCPSSTTPVYLLATGGDPTGSASTTINNQYIALMAALGQCGNLSASTEIQINEVTTVGAVWALHQYMAPPGLAASSSTGQGGSAFTGAGVNVGASSGPVGGYGTSAVQTQVVGLTNAFKMVNNLVNYTTGEATAVNSWANPDSGKLYALANIIASCVNTNPAMSTTCSTLMTAGAAGGYTPQDTVQLAYLMASYPTSNVTAINSYASTVPPFGGATASPADFTVEVGLAPKSSLTAAAIAQANYLAVDEWGHVWISNVNTGNSAGNATAGAFISEIDADGKFLAGPYSTYSASGGYQATSGTYIGDPCSSTFVHTLAASAGQGIAVDQNNVVWIPNVESPSASNCDSTSDNSVMRIQSSGQNGTGASVLTGYYDDYSLASVIIDGLNNVWIPASANRVSTFYNATSSFNFTGYSTGSGPRGITMDNSGNVWIASPTGCSTTGTSILYQAAASTVASRAVLATSYNASGATGCTYTVSSDAVLTASNAGELYSIAADASGGIWGAAPNSSWAAYYSPNGSVWTNTNGATIGASDVYTSSANLGGMNQPYTVAVDGANHAWIANKATPEVVELAVSLNGTNDVTGVSALNTILMPASTTPYPNYPEDIVVDPSGNIWLPSSHTTGGLGNYMTVIVGAAAPVVTPLTFQAEYGRVGKLPQ